MMQPNMSWEVRFLFDCWRNPSPFEVPSCNHILEPKRYRCFTNDFNFTSNGLILNNQKSWPISGKMMMGLWSFVKLKKDADSTIPVPQQRFALFFSQLGWVISRKRPHYVCHHVIQQNLCQSELIPSRLLHLAGWRFHLIGRCEKNCQMFVINDSWICWRRRKPGTNDNMVSSLLAILYCF